MSATAPPSDTTGSDAALEQFEQLAASRGYTLSDPACNATPSADAVDTYTCYAITASGEPFIARTTLGSTDVIEFEIVAEPTQSLGPTAPADTAPRTRRRAPSPRRRDSFDPLAYFAAVFSADADQMAGLPSQTLAGSPADAYLRYQTEFSETRAEYDATAVEPANVYLTPSGVRVCLTADECVELADFQVIDGQLTNFTVDAHAIAPRLGRTGPVFPVGTGSAQVRAAYHTVSTDELSVFVEVTASTADVFELSAAVYVAPGRHPDADRHRTLDRGTQRHDEGHAHARPAVPRRRPRRHRSLPRVPRRRRPTARRSAPGRTGHAVASRRRFPFNGERKVASTAAGGVRARGAGSADQVRLVDHAAARGGPRR